MTLYLKALKALPLKDIDHTSFQSDLYLRDSKEARRLIEDSNLHCSTFIDQIDHCRWLMIFGQFPYRIYKNIPEREHQDIWYYESYDPERNVFLYTNGLIPVGSTKQYYRELEVPFNELETYNWA